ncbi:MAG: hypothetical protein J6P16_03715 [Eubacterium sp.]|nr:hypothetical protein [Eubacterium sp.]
MRHFLQGLGLGLLVAALVMGINTRNQSSADESVVEQARALGMVFPKEAPEQDIVIDTGETAEADTDTVAEAGGAATGAGAGVDEVSPDGSDVSADGVSDDEALTGETPEPAQSKEPKKTKKPKSTATPKPEKTKKPERTADPDASSDPNATPSGHKNLPEGTVVTFEVRSGLLSSSVARELYEAGIIEDMWAFDHYIEERGLGHYLIAGSYELKVGASYEEIANIITHRE